MQLLRVWLHTSTLPYMKNLPCKTAAQGSVVTQVHKKVDVQILKNIVVQAPEQQETRRVCK